MTVRINKPAINVREELADLRKPTGVAGEAMLRANNVPDQAELLGYRQSNVLINGSFEIAQRGTTITGVDNGDYTVDRWKIIEGSTPVFTATQSTDAPDGFAHSLKLDVTTADTSVAASDYCILNQPIEGNNILPFASGTTGAKSHTLSFWVKSNVTGAYVAGLRYEPSGYELGQAYTIDHADTWEYKTVVFPPQTLTTPTYDNSERMSLFFWLMSGSNYSGGSSLETGWSTTNNTRAVGQVNLTASTANEFLITGTQLVAGSYPDGLPFKHRSYGEELAACQRYYEVLYADSEAAANVSAYTTTAAYGHMKMQPKRAAPTMLVSAATTFRVRSGGNNLNLTTIGFNDPTATGNVRVNCTTSGLVVGDSGWLSRTSNGTAYIHADAEL
jgi:hypothetical protein